MTSSNTLKTCPVGTSLQEGPLVLPWLAGALLAASPWLVGALPWLAGALLAALPWLAGALLGALPWLAAAFIRVSPNISKIPSLIDSSAFC